VNAAHTPHLADARLLACCLFEGDTGHLLPAEVDAIAHLKRCGQCRRRLDRIRWQVDVLRDEERARVDALFSAEHLESQRAQILRRLEHIGRHARVITFPAGGRRQPDAGRVAAVRMRWVAAAAAAGLAVGLGLGALMNFQIASPSSSPARQAVAARAPDVHINPVAKLSDPSFSDEAFLSEIDQALGRRAAELEALDALTPHVRDTMARR
jgi:hypothetical protein